MGLDHYEVRTWPSWHRYITLGMMALAWLASARAMLPDEDCFPHAPVLNPEIDVDPALAAPGEKSPPFLNKALARRRWLPGAFLKFAA